MIPICVDANDGLGRRKADILFQCEMYISRGARFKRDEFPLEVYSHIYMWLLSI
jgi:hypothetical protein